MRRKFTIFAPIALCAHVCCAHAAVTISGIIIVTDDNEPAAGASVVDITNRKYGVVADVDGRFSMSVPNASDIIEISYIGTESQKFTARELQSGKTIYLTTAPYMLNEIVVIGQRPTTAATPASTTGNGCEDEDNDRIIAELALCSTHAYNIGLDQNPENTSDKQLIKDAVALKTTIMTQQMNKQYEYLESMMRRFKTQLEKAVLTTKLQKAGASSGNGVNQ